MRSVKYEQVPGNMEDFRIAVNAENQITELGNSGDPYRMNWVKGTKAWGTVRCAYDLSAVVRREFTERGTLRETYVFENCSDFDIYATGTDLGIYAPFSDYYAEAATCMTQCCNTHIWCGGSSSYIMALRMGGEGPNLGLVLREGQLQGYSVERIDAVDGKEENLSNQRGDFILHPDHFKLRPGETYTLSWELFWFQDKEEFKRRLRETPGFVVFESESYVRIGKEQLSFTVNVDEDGLVILENGKEIPYKWENGLAQVNRSLEDTGEYRYEVCQGGRSSRAAFLKLPDIHVLAKKRCGFIAKYQQCCDEDSHLNGAYLIYDNEEKRQFYSHRNDHNGARERVGMGVLMARFLQQWKDEKLQKSLDRYELYVLRELFDEKTGEVFNDAPRCRDYIRLYNYPWVGRLFLELYHLKGDAQYLERFYKCMTAYYREGGDRYYAIGIPMEESIRVFREAKREAQAGELLRLYRAHGEFICACGRNYPAHEVNYEQSIVAPAAIYMCELYRITGEEAYQRAAAEQLEVLDLFQGFQPDYHMNEVAIRHWDGYWFGKRRCLGDTFPHYWSALSGYAYRGSAEIMEGDVLEKKSEKTLRAVLSLIREDGSASCAMVYPMSVNGRKASYYDPWANDQDWGLYFYLKYGCGADHDCTGMDG